MAASKTFQNLARIISRRPLVIGTLNGAGSVSSQLRQARRAKIDVLEVRLDTFPQVSRRSVEAVVFARSLFKMLRHQIRSPLLLTLRSWKEASSVRSERLRLCDHWRRDVLKELIPLCDLLDIEIRAGKLTKEATLLAHKLGKSVIHSFHDFKGVPPPAMRQNLLKRSVRLGGDFLKLAVTPRTEADLRSFLFWGRSIKEIRPILIAMGRWGTLSRFIGYSFGSLVTYGHLGRSAAPGQISVDKLAKSVREIYN